MEMYSDLDKEILLRKELLENIQKETLQVEEVGKGKWDICLLLSAGA